MTAQLGVSSRRSVPRRVGSSLGAQKMPNLDAWCSGCSLTNNRKLFRMVPPSTLTPSTFFAGTWVKDRGLGLWVWGSGFGLLKFQYGMFLAVGLSPWGCGVHFYLLAQQPSDFSQLVVLLLQLLNRLFQRPLDRGHPLVPGHFRFRVQGLGFGVWGLLPATPAKTSRDYTSNLMRRRVVGICIPRK